VVCAPVQRQLLLPLCTLLGTCSGQAPATFMPAGSLATLADKPRSCTLADALPSKANSEASCAQGSCAP
jgi:hypothetical protein